MICDNNRFEFKGECLHPDDNAIRIGCLNVDGLKTIQDKRLRLIKLMEEKRLDILGVQETNLKKAIYDENYYI